MFKTIYSRFGNVKANKFAATYEDQNSEGYNSEEFENLNDIETVLDRVGIKLRENASTWRDIDTVLEEIAENWKTWDRTTQNAVATAVAGTRQRENVITLFENWDDVAKYAEIAENAYGTATEKMEAYTDSIEASKQRMTVAVEEWALKLNQSDAIKAFYDQLAFLIKNIHTISLTLAGLGLATNFQKVSKLLFSGLTKVSTKLLNLGGKFTYGRDVNNAKGQFASAKNSMKETLEQDFVFAQQEAYGSTLNRYIKVIDAKIVADTQSLQSGLLLMDSEGKATTAELFNANMTWQDTQATIQKLSATNRKILADTLAAQVTDQETQATIESIRKDQTLSAAEQDLQIATILLTQKRKEMASTPTGSQMFNQVGANLGNASKQNMKSSVLGGAGALLGGALGAYAGSALGDIPFLGDTGKTVGTMVGGLGGSMALQAVTSGVGGALPWIGTAVMIGGTIYKIVTSSIQKAREKAQEEFKELEEELSSTKSMTVVAAKFDELSKGVDKFGRNVNLSDEDYQSFLETSNQLCDTIPQLTGYIDEQGNKIVDLGKNAQTAAEYVAQLAKEQQEVTDKALIDPDVMVPALEEFETEFKNQWEHIEQLKKDWNKAKDKRDSAQKALENHGAEEDLILYKALINAVDNKKKGAFILDSQSTQDTWIEEARKELGDVSNNYTDEQIREMIKIIYSELDMGEYNASMLHQYVTSSYINAADKKVWDKEILQEKFDEAQAALDVLTTNNGDIVGLAQAEYELEQLEQSMIVYGEGYARLFNDYTALGTEGQELINSLISDIKLTKNGKLIGGSAEAAYNYYLGQVENIINRLSDKFNENPQIFTLAAEIELAPTIKDEAQARQALLKAMIEMFGEEVFNNLDVFERMGFKYIGFGETRVDDFIDTTDKKQQLAEKLGWEADSNLFQIVWRNWGLDEMSSEDFQKVFNLAASGQIGASTSLSILRNLMRSDVSGGKTKEEAQDYYEDLSAQQGSIIDRVKNFYRLFKNGATPENVSTYFSDLPENLRTAILEGSEAGGLKNWEEVANDIQNAYDVALSSSKLNLAKTYSQYAFAGIEDKNGDEILGEWSEIQEMIEATAESYDLLRTAQEEYAESNRITWQTALKLMETNPEYMKFLDVTDKGITFKKLEGDTTTEKVAMMMQVSTIEKNATTKEESLISRNKTLSELMANMNESDPLYATYSEELSRNEAQLLALEQLKSAIAEIVESGFSREVFEKHFGSEALTAVEKLTTALESLNKEYEQMMGYGSTGNPASWMKEEYYKVKENNLDTLITNANNELTKKFGNGYTLAQILDISSQADREKYLGYYNDIQKYTVEQKNLDDEQAQDAINILKGKKADLSQVAEAYWDKILTSDTEEEFYENYQQYLDAYMADFDKKIEDIQYKIDVLEKSKPQEWRTAIDEDGKILEKAENRIDTYYTKMGKYYQDQYNEAAKALENVAFLTEDEIKKLVNQANDSLKKMKENDIAKAEAIKDYQEKVYSALRNEVNRYIDDLNDQKKVIEEIYDTELEKLKDKEDAISRTNKLIELQNNLLNAQKEKERVYRAGIGWTYESNRNKVREAEKQIDDFYRQDNIDDLNNAKDAELKNLEDRVQNWQKYLDMLEEQYKEYEVSEEKRLLKELLGVETDEQIKDIIVKDLNEFVTQIGEKYDLFTKDQDVFYSNYHSAFSTFLDDYAKNLGTLAELKGTELELMSLPEEGGLGLDLVNWEQVDYSDKADKADTLEMVDTYLRLRTLKAMNKGIDISGEGAYRSNEQIRNEWLANHSGEYSNGILGGPVSYTGLAMLHGSPSKPEYVLNNDQAYNLLRYMSTTRMPAFNSTKCGDSGTQYIVQGDIILEGVNNPQEFWGEVTKAMGNRWNVTKNR